MKKLIQLAFFLLLIPLSAFAQVFQWAQKQENGYFINQLSSPSYSFPVGGKFVAAGNNLIGQTGFFTQSITFGNQTFTSVDTLDAYLAMHDAAGNLLWAKHLQGTTPVQPTVEIDGTANVIIAGSFTDSLHIGGLLFKASRPDRGGIYAIKYDAAGNLLWARSSDITNRSYPTYLGEANVATDGAGNIYVAGGFSDTLTFGGTNLVASFQNNLFMAKYSATGVLQWARNPASSGFGLNFKPDAAGNIYLVKTIINPTFTHTRLIQKIDTAGIVAWTKFFPKSWQFGIDLTLDATGEPLISGYYSGNLVLGTTTLSTTSVSCFLTSLDAAGNWKWARNIAENLTPNFSIYFAGPPHITFTPARRIAVAGSFSGTAQFPGSSFTPPANASGTFIMQLDTAGTLQWVSPILNDSTWNHFNEPSGIASDNQGNLYVSGTFRARNYFGTIPLHTAASEATFLTKVITVANPLAAQEPKAGLHLFQLYPNPARNYVMVAAELKKPTPATVRLVNILGQTVSEVKLPSNTQLHYQLPLNNLPKGVYIVQLETENGRQSQRLVIQ